MIEMIRRRKSGRLAITCVAYVVAISMVLLLFPRRAYADTYIGGPYSSATEAALGYLGYDQSSLPQSVVTAIYSGDYAGFDRFSNTLEPSSLDATVWYSVASGMSFVNLVDGARADIREAVRTAEDGGSGGGGSGGGGSGGSTGVLQAATVYWGGRNERKRNVRVYSSDLSSSTWYNAGADNTGNYPLLGTPLSVPITTEMYALVVDDMAQGSHAYLAIGHQGYVSSAWQDGTSGEAVIFITPSDVTLSFANGDIASSNGTTRFPRFYTSVANAVLTDGLVLNRQIDRYSASEAPISGNWFAFEELELVGPVQPDGPSGDIPYYPEPSEDPAGGGTYIQPTITFPTWVINNTTWVDLGDTTNTTTADLTPILEELIVIDGNMNGHFAVVEGELAAIDANITAGVTSIITAMSLELGAGFAVIAGELAATNTYLSQIKTYLYDFYTLMLETQRSMLTYLQMIYDEIANLDGCDHTGIEDLLEELITNNHADLLAVIDAIEGIESASFDDSGIIAALNTIDGDLISLGQSLEGWFGDVHDDHMSIKTSMEDWFETLYDLLDGWLQKIYDRLESMNDDYEPVIDPGNTPQEQVQADYSRLKNKFPFSVPWDLYLLLNLLDAPGAPIEFDYPIPYIGTLHIDLSCWESIAAVTRALSLFQFAWFLMRRTKELVNLNIVPTAGNVLST